MEEQVQSEGTAMEQPRKGWFGRNCVWFVPTVVFVPLLICAGGCVVIVLLILGWLKGEAYEMALERVQSDPEVIAVLGEPIEPGFMVTGQLNAENGRGSAKLYFDVTGPKGKAKVTVDARRVGGIWGLTQLRVEPEGGEPILLDVSEDGDEEAPEAGP